jgi:hypothetical protein
MVTLKEYKKALKNNFELVEEQINISCQIYELNCEQLQNSQVIPQSSIKDRKDRKDRNKNYEHLLQKLMTVRVELQKNREIRDRFINKLYSQRMKREIKLNIIHYNDSIASRTRHHDKTQAFYNRNCLTFKIGNRVHVSRYFPDR